MAFVICHKTPSFGFDCSIGFCDFFMAAYNLLLPYSNQMFPKITENIYGTFLTAEAVGGLYWRSYQR